MPACLDVEDRLFLVYVLIAYEEGIQLLQVTPDAVVFQDDLFLSPQDGMFSLRPSGEEGDLSLPGIPLIPCKDGWGDIGRVIRRQHSLLCIRDVKPVGSDVVMFGPP